MTLIRNSFHKEVGPVWGCLWWAREEAPSQYPHQVVLENFPGPWLPISLLGSCLFSKLAFLTLLIDSVRSWISLFCCDFCDTFSLKQFLWFVTLNQPVHSKEDRSWVFFGRNDAKAETPVLGPPHVKSLTHWKRL